jgi:hypothetical protein
VRQQNARLGAAVRARLERHEDVLLGLLAEARYVLQAPVFGGAVEIVERLDTERLVQLACALRPEPGNASDLDQARGDPLLQLLGGRDPARLEQGVDLLGDRLADSRQLRGPAGPRQLCHGHPGLPDRLRRVAVGQHAVHDGAVELVQARQLLEGLRYLAVAHGR